MRISRPSKFKPERKHLQTGVSRPDVPLPRVYLLPETIHRYNQSALHRIEAVWRRNGLSGQIPARLCSDIFGRCPAPYLCLIDLVRFCSDYYKHQNDGLTMNILTSFKNWICRATTPVTIGGLDKPTKMKAFQVMIGQNSTLVSEVISDVFQLETEPELFTDYLRGMLSQCGDYAKVCRTATTLRMFGVFGVDEFLVPLYLTAQNSVAEGYLDKAIDQRLEFVRYLDSIIGRSVHAVATDLGMSQPVSKQVTSRALSKYVANICKRYNLDVSEAAPLFYDKSMLNAVHFLFHRRYTLENIHSDDFVEMLSEILDGRESVIRSTLTEIANCHGDVVIFKQLCTKLNQSPESYDAPGEGSDLYLGHPPLRSARHPFHRFTLPSRVKINLIDRPELVDSMLSQLSQYEGVLAFDVEWCPVLLSHSAGSVKPALLQVATGNTVYLVDLYLLRKFPNGFQLLSDVANAVFGCKNTKLVFEGMSDFKALSDPMGPFDEAIQSPKNVLDLKTVSARIDSVYPDLLPTVDDVARKLGDSSLLQNKGLSQLMIRVLGLWLDKTEQCSYWHGRPLRLSQQQYAAIDAYCLLLLYDEISARLARGHDSSIKTMMQFSVTGQNTNVNQESRARSEPITKTKQTERILKTASVQSDELPNRVLKNQSQTRSKPNTKTVETAPVLSAHSSFVISDVCWNDVAGMGGGEHQLRNIVEPGDFHCSVDDTLLGLGKRLQSIGVDVVFERTNANEDVMSTTRRSCDRGAGDPDRRRVVMTVSKRRFQHYSSRLPSSVCVLLRCDKVERQLFEVLKLFRVNVPPSELDRKCQECNCPDYWHVNSATMRQLVAGSCSELTASASCWIPLEDGDTTRVDVTTGQIENCSVKVKSHFVSRQLLDTTRLFYVCQLCGHVYWPGCYHAVYDTPRAARPRDPEVNVLPAESIRGLSLNDSDSDWSD